MSSRATGMSEFTDISELCTLMFSGICSLSGTICKLNLLKPLLPINVGSIAGLWLKHTDGEPSSFMILYFAFVRYFFNTL